LDPKKSFFKLNFSNFTLDLLPEIQSNIRFNDAYSKRDSVTVDDIEIHFISLIDLIHDKKKSIRKKDLEDLNELKKLNDNK
uniref:hypothetical protein n=1 Tax=Chryseobacterium sp. TaxID=1871047 RepID=UPI0025BE1AEC